MNKPKLILASANKGKIKEISDMLNDYEVVGYKDLGLDFDIEEDGKTFYENALIKAKAVSKALNLPALADDSGLCVDALNGEPGIYSARYAGDGKDSSNIAKLLTNMSDITDRNASFVCCMVLYFPDGKIITSTGKTLGKILFSKEGNSGFGYDPIFYSDDLKKSFGVASEQEKNTVSHRARALKELKEQLKSL